jgi:hypothetical protein
MLLGDNRFGAEGHPMTRERIPNTYEVVPAGFTYDTATMADLAAAGSRVSRAVRAARH